MDERISRRNFLRGVGASAVAGAVAKAAAAAQSVESLDDQKAVGPEPIKLVLQVNGKRREVEVEPRVTLLDALRNRLSAHWHKGSLRSSDLRRMHGACEWSTGLLLHETGNRDASSRDHHHRRARWSDQSDAGSTSIRRVRRIDVRILHSWFCDVVNCAVSR